MTVLIACLWRPALGRHADRDELGSAHPHPSRPAPALGHSRAVIGSIYVGCATATEAAALGILAAFAYAAYERSLTWKVLGEIFEGTARTTGMIMAIVIGAYFLKSSSPRSGCRTRSARW